MTDLDRPDDGPEHPWCEIDLGVYEQHMSDAQVGQLQLLHEITAEQLSAYRPRTVGVLGVAGGNGLDLIDPHTTDAIYGYDVNQSFLDACAARFESTLGGQLHLIATRIDERLSIERVDLLIANLIIEYVGLEEFVAFAVANVHAIGVLSCVIQRNEGAGFVSSTKHSSSFDGLASISSDIDAAALTSALSAAAFVETVHRQHSLPNGKSLIRKDFRPA